MLPGNPHPADHKLTNFKFTIFAKTLKSFTFDSSNKLIYMAENNQNDSTEKKYIGRIEKKPTALGQITKIGFHRSDLEFMLNNLNERDYCNVVLKDRQDGSGFITIDKYHKKA